MSKMPENKNEIFISYLNGTFLEKAMKELEDDLQVVSYHVTRVTSEGDNYASELYRVRVLYTTKGQQRTRSLVIKIMPSMEDIAKIIKEADLFGRETTALSSVLPKIHSQLEEAAPSQLEPFSPKHFHSQSSPELIVMEDLVQKGFRMAERSTGLDMDHSLLVMRKIARCHASSAVLHEKHPEVFHPVYESVYIEKFRHLFHNYFQIGFKRVVNEVENWPDYKDRFVAKLHNLADRTTDTLMESLKRDDDEFNVFRHGDLWVNNMMFLYSEEGCVESVRFLDYQLCHFGSPAADLHYFIHTSVSTDLISRHHELVQEYHKTLTETFSLLGYQHLAPSLAQLEQQLANKSEYAIIISCTVLPLVMADPDYIPDMEKMFVEENTIHFSEIFKGSLKKHLSEFERKGWL